MIKWLINLFLNRPNTAGWSIADESVDDRDFKFGDAFKDEIFGAVIPDEFEWNLLQIPEIPYQGGILSCVSCACTFINSFYSKLEKNDVFHSWPFLYKQVPHLSGGTRIADNLNSQVKTGQCVDNLMPQNNYNRTFDTEAKAKTRDDLTSVMFENAKHYKTKGYFRISHRSEVEMKTAIMKAPTLIGVYTSWSEWRNKPVIVDKRARSFGHVVCLRGWNKDGWLVVDWNQSDPFKILSYQFPIITSYGIFDIPDTFLETTMKAYKLQNTDKIFIILPNGKKQHVSSPKQWKGLNDKKLISGSVQPISQEELNRYPTDEEPIVIAK